MKLIIGGDKLLSQLRLNCNNEYLYGGLSANRWEGVALYHKWFVEEELVQ